MASDGPPACFVEGCDGNLYREFLTGLNRSTAQMLALGGYGLLIGPLLLGSPFILRVFVSGSTADIGETMVTVVLIVIPMVVGLSLLRYRKQRLAVRKEQQRCSKCGAVFPPAI